ncbi:pilus assembly protein PilS [Neisseria meningitidis]|uniref:pilus assembly protein PilS n=1 Tax=Neisseria meningitidis TaxID=487 RepID=UPI0002FA5CC5|nr:pilus assembly protein PilS [Neisseria meningitidis]MBG8842161.1 pilus assembly protein PilS [Neisseria meningitidis]MBG8989640.1 pilus assembly protein PilS [Neisseria meningitidis]PVZ44681.1 pilus assembly protein PilS [Neisseria meningitidis]RNK01511.1 pilus assembly protein PilS [Neisseria meningitidis]RNK16887.1 pilus assembly protein PilS [Neisseria meningitidis]
MPSEARYGKLRQKQKPESHHSHSRESGFLGFRCFSVSMNFQAAVPDKYPQSKIPSFPRRWESRFIRTETDMPSFPRKRESRFFGTETYRIKRFL